MSGGGRTAITAGALACVLASIALTANGCGGSGSSTPTTPTPVASATPTPTATPTPGPTLTPEIPTPKPPVTMFAVGDIGWCGAPEVGATAALIEPGTSLIALLGDIAYPDGTDKNFADCFHPFWGRHRDRSRPVPGNHEYSSPNPTAAPYYAYFGASAGNPSEGYYAYEAGEWLVLAINSNIPSGYGSAQMQWVKSTLAGSRHKCSLAYWHHPRFSSGKNGDTASMSQIWAVLDKAGVDLVLSGHDHMYERLAPQDADGRYDPSGIRQFVVGTGGAPLYDVTSVKANSEVRSSTHGVLRLTLTSGSYDWEFLPIAGKSFRDSGNGSCM